MMVSSLIFRFHGGWVGLEGGTAVGLKLEVQVDYPDPGPFFLSIQDTRREKVQAYREFVKHIQRFPLKFCEEPFLPQNLIYNNKS